MFGSIFKGFLAEVEKDFSLANIQAAEEKGLAALNSLAKLTVAASTVAAQVAPFTGTMAGEVAAGAALGSAIGTVVDNSIPDTPKVP